MLLARSSLFFLRELSREENPTGESGEKEEEFSCLGSCQLMSVRRGNAAAVVMGSCRLGTCDCFCFSFLFLFFVLLHSKQI